MELFILCMAGNCLVIKPLHILCSGHGQILIMCILNNFFLLAQVILIGCKSKRLVQDHGVKSWKSTMLGYGLHWSQCIFMVHVFRMRTSNKKSPDILLFMNISLWFSQLSCLIYSDNNKEKLDSHHSKISNIVVTLPWSEKREQKNSDYTFLGDSWPSMNWFCLGECGACKKNK